jgi:uncharacterized membrane protein required for colicin V production
MLSLFLFIILVISFSVGFRRGFILQLMHLLGLVVSFIAAYLYYEDVAHYIRLWVPFPQFGEGEEINLLVDSFSMETVYYNGIAFALIFFLTKIVMQIIASLFDFVAHIPVLSFVNGWLGGLLGFLEGLVMITILLHIAALVQVDVVQAALQNSTFAQMIFEYTPIISNELKELWIEGRNN